MGRTCVPDAAAIGFDPHLDIPLPTFVAHGLDPQDGRIGVGTDHGDGVPRLPKSSVFLDESRDVGNGAITCHFFPTAKATIVELFRVK